MCDEIRKIFADSRYFRRWAESELHARVYRHGPPLKRPGETFSRKMQRQTVEYLTRDMKTTLAWGMTSRCPRSRSLNPVDPLTSSGPSR